MQMTNEKMQQSAAVTTMGSTTIPERYHCRNRRRRVLNRTAPNIYSSPCLLILILVSYIASTRAFQSTSHSRSQTNNWISFGHSSSQTALCVSFPGFNNNGGNDSDKDKNNDWNPNNIFESFKNLFGNKDAENNQDNGMGDIPALMFSQFFQPPGLSSEDYYDELGYFSDEEFDDDDEDDELPAGTSMLFRIQAKQLKPGGLRLFLMFYLLGMQNTPDKNTWRADQRLMSVNASPKGYEESEDEPEDKKYVLEMLYDKDRTGMLQIELLPEKAQKQAEIRIYRCGSRPSTSYLMQESVIVDGVLDELQNIAGEKDLETTIPRSDNPNVGNELEIAQEDRLLITDPPNAIEAARESLAFS
mmetsp:Transcript_12155/g.30762  ORF Transcript_12155/g.30762 Transcript_12155/m.30762 type:complete len:359 (+) Transcript_12155:239-1315(+)